MRVRLPLLSKQSGTEISRIIWPLTARGISIMWRGGYQEITERGYLLISLVSLICTFACFAWMGITIPLIINTTSELEQMATNKLLAYCNATALREDTMRVRVSASSRKMSLDKTKESSPLPVDRSGRQLNSLPNTFSPNAYPQRPDQAGYARPTMGCCKPGPPGGKGKTGNNGKIYLGLLV